jgi:hypothetical protein
VSDPTTQTSGGAGWHPDPSGQHQLRYWDGQAWTANVSDNGVSSTDAYTAAPPAYGAAAARTGRGPVGKTTNPGTAIMLSIVTLGIYTFIWTYRQFEDFKKYSGTGMGGGVGVVLGLFVNPVVWFMIPIELKAMYEAEGQACPVEPTIGLWFLLPIIGNFIWYGKVQAAINDFWMARGAPAPS